MKQTFSGDELRSHARGGIPAGRTPPEPDRAPGAKNRPAGGCLKWTVALLLTAGLLAAGAAALRYFLGDAPAGEAPVPVQEDGGSASAGKTVAETESAAELAARGREYLAASEDDMRQLYMQVAISKVVTGNDDYLSRLRKVAFEYEPDDNAVNAYSADLLRLLRAAAVESGDEAALKKIEQTADEMDPRYLVHLQGGAVRYSRLVCLAAAAEAAGGREGTLRATVRNLPLELCIHCGEDECLRFLRERGLLEALADPEIRTSARMLSEGMIVGILAHECGHVLLGHTSSSADEDNLEVSRNQEREADSFAASVSSSGTASVGNVQFQGQILFHYALAQQTDGLDDGRGSHPQSAERVDNFIRADPDRAKMYGLVD